jgi:hypothetical protein
MSVGAMKDKNLKVRNLHASVAVPLGGLIKFFFALFPFFFRFWKGARENEIT